jgi:hypothetical protein
MITENDLKLKCSPDFINFLCELAEGFECEIENLRDPYIKFNNSDRIFISELFRPFNVSFLSTLIHRAVDGWNKKHGEKYYTIDTIVDSIVFMKNQYPMPMSIKYKFSDYQPQSLTQAECACLHCLHDIFKEAKGMSKAKDNYYQHLVTKQNCKTGCLTLKSGIEILNKLQNDY